MRNDRLLLPLLPLSLLVGAFGLVSSSCGGGSSGGSNSDCFDYSGFAGTTPTVSFSHDVLPIFRTSCGVSSVCHGCDTSADPACTNPGFKPFLGIPMGGAAPSAAQIAAIITSTVGAPASVQAGTTADGKMVGNPDMSIVTAGDAQHSFLTYKLDGNFPSPATSNDVSCSTLTCASTESCGQAMPSAGMQLPSAERDIIRRWIIQGAQNN
jgi:hypothetical protein